MSDGALITPVFLLSLPRSGSTLVQRMLATHGDVATTAEPWLLLPHLYATTAEAIYTDYHQEVAVRGITDFIEALPGGESAYREDLRGFILRQYRRAAGETPTLFLDKTPRYHRLADRLLGIFPDARLIVLWRNPLAVASSIMETWQEGRWDLYRWRVDLYGGLDALCRLAAAGDERVLALRFEDVLAAPTASLDRLFAHLGLTAPADAADSFDAVELAGRLGDRVGSNRYRSLSTEPLEKWPRGLANPLRRRWASRYLDWIGEERLSLMGYDAGALRSELRSEPVSTRFLLSDVYYRAKGALAVAVDPRPTKDKVRALRSGRPVYLHA